MNLNVGTAGLGLLAVVSIFLIFQGSLALAKKLRYGANNKVLWLISIIAFLFGISQTQQQNLIGFIFCLPVVMYIFVVLVEKIKSPNFEKVGRGIWTVTSSASSYIFAHHFFGFGIAEGSLTALATAAILGFFGYRA